MRCRAVVAVRVEYTDPGVLIPPAPAPSAVIEDFNSDEAQDRRKVPIGKASPIESSDESSLLSDLSDDVEEPSSS